MSDLRRHETLFDVKVAGLAAHRCETPLCLSMPCGVRYGTEPHTFPLPREIQSYTPAKASSPLLPEIMSDILSCLAAVQVAFTKLCSLGNPHEALSTKT